MKLCILCHEREAQIPDRDNPHAGKQICRQCHANRLIGDLKGIMATVQARRGEPRKE